MNTQQKIQKSLANSKDADLTDHSINYDKLPLTLELPLSDRPAVERLLLDLATATMTMEAAKETVEKLKADLEGKQRAFGLTGFRFERLCFLAREMSGRRTLDKMMLIENGVKPSVIEESMKKGKPFMERRFVVIGAKHDG